MSNNFKRIHYACKIITNITSSSPSIGLTDGVFRFISDGYTLNENSSYFDDNQNEYTQDKTVEDYWNTDLLKYECL
jgi:hypothetical protein